ncbi:MAG: hypothetical protein WCO75_06535 [Planctomycetota bacterium]
MNDSRRNLSKFLPVIAAAISLGSAGFAVAADKGSVAPATGVGRGIGASSTPIVIPSIFAWDPGSKFTVDPTITEAPNTGCRFGFAVAMSDNYAVVGAPDIRLVDNRFPALNLGTNGAGAAFVFKRSAGTDTWTFVQRLIAPTRVLAQTGCSVAIDAVTNDIVVGAWGYDAVAMFGGAAFVYTKGSDDSWGEAANAAAYGSLTRIPTQVLAPEELQPIDQFGFAVAIDNGTIAAGCPLSGSSNTGAIYVYERNTEGTYDFTQKLEDEAAGANDQTGTKLAMHGNLLVAGAQNDDIQGRINAGSALVFSRLEGIWDVAARVTAPVPAAAAQFGSAVAVFDGNDADWLLVGAPTQSSGATIAVAGNGAAYIMKSVDNGITWSVDSTLLPRADNINNNFGYSVALSHTEPPQVLVGSPGYDTAIPSIDDPTIYRQIINAGAGFTFAKTGSTWAIRGTGQISGDLWGPGIAASTSIGRAVAVSPTKTAFCIVSAETPTGGLGSAYPFEFRNAQIGSNDDSVSGPAWGVLDVNGHQIIGGGTPGTGSGGTGGTIAGGGAPAGGITSGPGAITLPLLPIVKDWGVIKGSAIALSGNNVSILQTDGKQVGHKASFTRLGTLPAGARYVGCGDMNGDMSGDVCFVDDHEVLRYWKRDAKKILEVMTIDTLPVGFDAITVADFDHNGKDDVLLRGILDPLQLIVWNIDGGAIASTIEYELPAGNWDVFTGNFRVKTTPDILLRDRDSGEVRVLVGGSSGTATFPVIATRSTNYRLAGFGDIDGNGQPDIFWQGAKDEVDLMDQDEAGNYIRTARRRTGLADGHIVNIRDWNDDGTIDFWIRRGDRNFIQYGSFAADGFVYGNGACDLGNAPGKVMDVANR